MYLEQFKIEQIKCFEDTTMRFPSEGGHAGFHVILGENGTGKSTLLQAMALVFLGPQRAPRLALDHWPRQGATHGRLSGKIKRGDDDINRGSPRKTPYSFELWITGERAINKLGDAVSDDDSEYVSNQPTLMFSPTRKQIEKSLRAGPYSGRPGWFAAGYGPFRRLTGSDRADVEISSSARQEVRFLTLFSEGAALFQCERWLVTLYTNASDANLPKAEQARAQESFDAAKRIINALLPSAVQIAEVNSKGVKFITQGGIQVGLSSLSDGYRSYLALAVDLLRLMERAEGLSQWITERAGELVVTMEGVVLIDEADIHLHPEWQRRLGFELTRIFPKVQFIVTTHSPFIAMAARPGGLFRLQRTEGGQVEIHPEPSAQGWRTEQVLLSPLFGLSSTRDPDTMAKLAERAELMARGSLDAEAQARLQRLERVLSSRLTAPGDTVEARDTQRAMQAYVQETLRRLEAGGS